MVGPIVRWVAARAIHGLVKGRSLNPGDPKGIIEDASDPSVPALEVLARAKAVSRTGKLVEKVQELIDRRPGFPEQIAKSIFGE